MTTKIHALVDGGGIIRRFLLSPGEKHDAPFALPLLETVELSGSAVMADRGYDSDAIVEYIEQHEGVCVIPPKTNRRIERPYDSLAYKHRNVIERFFCRLKQFRKIATRFDKLADSFAAFILIAAIVIALKFFLGHALD